MKILLTHLASVSIILLLSQGTTIADDNLLINGSFEDGESGWTRKIHEKPAGTVALTSEAVHSGQNALFLHNETGVKPYFYEIFMQRIENLDPGSRYILRFWGKGDFTGAASNKAFGVSNDVYGNAGFSFAEVKSSTDWVEYEIHFRPDGDGSKFVIFRSADIIEGYYIDDVSVTQE